MSFCDFKEEKNDSHKDEDWNLKGVHTVVKGQESSVEGYTLRVPGGSISRWLEMKERRYQNLGERNRSPKLFENRHHISMQMKKTCSYECLHMLLYVWPSACVCVCVCVRAFAYARCDVQ